MGATPLVIIGAGGFGREVLDVVEAINLHGSRHSSSQQFEFLGFLDDGEPDLGLLERRSARHLGPVGLLGSVGAGTEFVIAIADSEARRLIDRTATTQGIGASTLVHPTATVGGDVELGAGTIVCSHVSVTTNIRTGSHVQLHVNSTVGHDARIGHRVTVLPGATVGGNVRLSDDVLIGTNACVLQGIEVGSRATVGAGAVVVRDVPAAVVVVGVPAHPLDRRGE